MKPKPWVRVYLLIVGWTVLALGFTLLVRAFSVYRSANGFILGAALMVYGFLRLRQSKQQSSS